MITKIMGEIAITLFLITSSLTTLPDGFVYLDEVDPTIQTSMRYFSTENFVGTRMDGYKKARIIMTKETAVALCKAQKEFLQDGYSLVIYDAYRPQKAVDHFVRWSTTSNNPAIKAKYYPEVAKEHCFKLGYISKKSGHTRGSTIDLTIIKVGDQLKTPTLNMRAMNEKQVPFLDDGTVDMGSSLDLFGPASHHDSPLMPQEYTDRRNYLRSKMVKHGFKTFVKEWWHYTLINEPFPNTYFDFDIE